MRVAIWAASLAARARMSCVAAVVAAVRPRHRQCGIDAT
jgi:hypothetical protein